jgi:hypothetical protein
MRRWSVLFLGVLGVGVGVFAGCGKKDEAPQPATPNQAPSGAYGQPYGQQGYPQQGYPQQGYPQQPPPPASVVPPGQMAVPGPAALPCSNDSMCLTHKCNTQYGKCAFPCESDNDCIMGAYCFKGPVPSCLPKPPQ